MRDLSNDTPPPNFLHYFCYDLFDLACDICALRETSHWEKTGQGKLYPDSPICTKQTRSKCDTDTSVSEQCWQQIPNSLRKYEKTLTLQVLWCSEWWLFSFNFCNISWIMTQKCNEFLNLQPLDMYNMRPFLSLPALNYNSPQQQVSAAHTILDLLPLQRRGLLHQLPSSCSLGLMRHLVHDSFKLQLFFF